MTFQCRKKHLNLSMKESILIKHNFLVEVTIEGLNSPNILEDYLSNRKQRTKMDSFSCSWKAILKQRTKMDSFSCSWKAILSWVPQGSIRGPLLFNIFMCGMFLILKGTYFTDYADDNTPFVVRDNIKDVIKALEEIGESLVNWFSNNEMKLNTDKCHLLLNSQETNTLKIGDLHQSNPPKTSDVSEFLILPYDQNRKLGNLGSFVLCI